MTELLLNHLLQSINSHRCERPTQPEEYAGRSSGRVCRCHHRLVWFLKDKHICWFVTPMSFFICVCVNVRQMQYIPLSCPTRLAFRAFLPLATSLSVTVVHRFILHGAERGGNKTNYSYGVPGVCVGPGVVTDQAFWDQCIMSSMLCPSVTKWMPSRPVSL